MCLQKTRKGPAECTKQLIRNIGGLEGDTLIHNIGGLVHPEEYTQTRNLGDLEGYNLGGLEDPYGLGGNRTQTRQYRIPWRKRM